jgi:hypothetical protein
MMYDVGNYYCDCYYGGRHVVVWGAAGCPLATQTNLEERTE